MADTRTRPGTDRRPLLSYLRVQRDREREMLAILNNSAARINAELARLAGRSGVGAAVRREQLALSQAAIHREMAAMWNQLGGTIQAGRAEAAAAAVEAMHPPELLASVFSKADRDYMLRSAQASAARGINTLEARKTLSEIPLAESVYNNTELANGKIDEIVNAALVSGSSAVELARQVRDYVRPDVRGGVRYAALRLGRTEINNAFHATQIKEGVKTPWTTGLKWNLSGSHPRPDECNEYADTVHELGKPAGVYTPENVPAKPHPNCLCFTTPETVSRDEFISQFMAGHYDMYLEEEFPGLPPLEIPKASVHITPPKPTSPAWSKVRTPKWAVDNLSKQAARLNEEDLATLTDYVQNGSFVPINASLRGVAPRLDPGMEDAFDLSAGIDPGWVSQEVASLDRAISKSLTPDSITLYRGVDDDVVGAIKRGSVIEDSGYMSTSLNPDVAGEFGSTIMRITYPWHRPALHIDAVEELNLGQNEVLLPRGVRMVVKSVRKLDGKTVINVEVE